MNYKMHGATIKMTVLTVTDVRIKLLYFWKLYLRFSDIPFCLYSVEL